MIINDNYLSEIEDYYAITLEKNEGLNSLVMTDNENSKYINALQRIYNHYLISNDKALFIKTYSFFGFMKIKMVPNNVANPAHVVKRKAI